MFSCVHETIEELPRNWKGSRLHDMEILHHKLTGLNSRQGFGWSAYDMVRYGRQGKFRCVLFRQDMADRADYGGLWSGMIWQFGYGLAW